MPQSRFAYTLLASALLSAACGADSTELEPTTTTTTTSSSSGGAAGAGGSGGQAPFGDIYVDATLGNDSNDGAFATPLKTIGVALQRWLPGRDVVLMAGTFAPASGETWDYEVPDGLTIKANGVGVVLEGTPSNTAFVSNGTVSYEYVTMRNFGVALSAAAGTVSAVGVALDSNATSIHLSGTAVASVSGFSTFLGTGSAAVLDGSCVLSVDTGSVQVGASPKFLANDSSSLLLAGLAVTGVGDVVYSYGAATVSITNTTVSGGGAVASHSSTGLLTLDTLTVVDSYSAADIFSGDALITNLSVSNCGEYGVSTSAAAGSISVVGATIQNCQIGALRSDGGTMNVSASYLTNASPGNTTGVSAHGGAVKVRNTTIRGYGRGVLADSATKPDLGSVSEYGQNTIMDNQVNFYSSGTPGITIARGNTWNASVQGADAQGHYATLTVGGPASGANYVLMAGDQLHF
ncbi:MAG: DUF1565 domain-containing protein [Polyangiaceae bacterium]|nr:DUF1565 domain-containing protein [Polyangiaceae bacterium]